MPRHRQERFYEEPRAARYPAEMITTRIGSRIGIALSLAAVSLGAPAASAQGVLIPTPVPDGALPDGPPPADVEQTLREVSAANVRFLTNALAGFGTRHTLSETESDERGIGAARRFIKEQFERYAAESGRSGDEAMRVYFDTHRVEPDGRRITRAVDVVNVVAELPGAMEEARDRRYYIIAHYDSRASDPTDGVSDAPGANDSASGVAALMELARVMSKRRYDATLVFMATAGEEQGLYGARRHAAEAMDAGENIMGLLNNDMIGDPFGIHAPSSDTGRAARRTVRVFSQGVPRGVPDQEIARIAGLGAENDSPARQLARYMATIAAWHDTIVKPALIYRNDRFLRGGDHTGFLEAGFSWAVRVTVPHEDYARQHQDVRMEDGEQYGDTTEHIDAGYLRDVTRLNGAVLAHLSRAPSPPPEARVLVADLTTNTTLRWSACPEPDTAGYEIVWRTTTSPVWEYAKNVGNVTETTIELSKDNWIFGVRSYDREGHRSPVAFPAAARE